MSGNHPLRGKYRTTSEAITKNAITAIILLILRSFQKKGCAIVAYRLKALPLNAIISNNTFKVTNCDLKNKDSNMADNIEHQDKGELVANCDRFNSLKHSTGNMFMRNAN